MQTNARSYKKHQVRKLSKQPNLQHQAQIQVQVQVQIQT
ncbi:MAG: hypothetical protein Gaeavirus16_3 [Gaeavirus sp.]|uniref:Uncharacterized protein n=1 Tax=Gaeavirus sp. TaxID=2487767 RepID=A0A3G4ZZ61_9VIRU|nr:MAG: hypothetical protein Gaeavirus16_3 [Gaeavirus sp.]